MAAPSHRLMVLKLYKNLLTESKRFSSYNFRVYAIRRIRDAFKANKEVVDPEKLNHFLKLGNKNLEIIKRQVIIGDMYKSSPLVIERVNRERWA